MINEAAANGTKESVKDLFFSSTGKATTPVTTLGDPADGWWTVRGVNRGNVILGCPSGLTSPAGRASSPAASGGLVPEHRDQPSLVRPSA